MERAIQLWDSAIPLSRWPSPSRAEIRLWYSPLLQERMLLFSPEGNGDPGQLVILGFSVRESSYCFFRIVNQCSPRSLIGSSRFFRGLFSVLGVLKNEEVSPLAWKTSSFELQSHFHNSIRQNDMLLEFCRCLYFPVVCYLPNWLNELRDAIQKPMLSKYSVTLSSYSVDVPTAIGSFEFLIKDSFVYPHQDRPSRLKSIVDAPADSISPFYGIRAFCRYLDLKARLDDPNSHSNTLSSQLPMFDDFCSQVKDCVPPDKIDSWVRENVFVPQICEPFASHVDLFLAMDSLVPLFWLDGPFLEWAREVIPR